MSTHGSDNVNGWEEPTDDADYYHEYSQDKSTDDRSGYRTDPTFDTAYATEEDDHHYAHQDSDWVVDSATSGHQDHDQQVYVADDRHYGANDQHYADDRLISGDHHGTNTTHYEEYDEYSGQVFRSNFDASAPQPIDPATARFSAHDFIEARPLPNRDNLKKFAMICSGVVLAAALSVMVYLTAQPELSKVDIVQMDGYGEQSVRQIFYSSQLPCGQSTDCSQPNAEAGNTLPLAVVQPNDNATEQYREIPAVLVNSDAYEGSGNEPLIQDEQLMVKLNWSNLRTQPDGDSDILVSLAKGTIVSVTGASGRWLHIKTLGDSPRHGYMHTSTVGPLTSP